MHFYAQEYSKALGRTITFQDIPVEPWRHALLERRWPVHVVNHLTAMADLHRAGRFDRMSDEVLMLTGERPLSVQEFVRKNAATFTTQAPDDCGRIAPIRQVDGKSDSNIGSRWTIRASKRTRRVRRHGARRRANLPAFAAPWNGSVSPTRFSRALNALPTRLALRLYMGFKP